MANVGVESLDEADNLFKEAIYNLLHGFNVFVLFFNNFSKVIDSVFTQTLPLNQLQLYIVLVFHQLSHLDLKLLP